MVKEMKIVMNDDLTIRIVVGNEKVLVISKENREISAKDIYDCFNYSKGDKYQITKEINAPNADKIVDSLETLFIDISSQLNALSDIDE